MKFDVFALELSAKQIFFGIIDFGILELIDFIWVLIMYLSIMNMFAALEAKDFL